MELEIDLPYQYSPRTYQREVFDAFKKGLRRFVLVWHRRSGKDKTMLNFMIVRMFERVGMYWYILPTYEQARLTIWEGMGSGINEGMPFLDHFPEQLIQFKNEQRMEIGLVNGSIFRLVGSDHIDRLVGANPIGVVFSEYSLQSIAAWEYVSPMLAENKGWAAFIFTPRGRNHAFFLYEKALPNKTWFTTLKTVEDTFRDSEEELEDYKEKGITDPVPVVSKEALEEEVKAGREESIIQQEYYCSFVGFREGSYYGEDMAAAYREGRIGNYPWDPKRMVFTCWDLGVADQMAIWFAQVEGRAIYLIDFHQESNKGLVHFIKIVKNKPYVYSNHWAPHDIEQRELSSGRSRLEIARDLGINFRVIPRMSLMDGIDSARATIARCYFNKETCDMGVRSLINYHKDYNNKTLDYKPHPVHDKWSHGADAFRGLSIIVDREVVTQTFTPQIKAITEFDIFGDNKQEDISDIKRIDNWNIFNQVPYRQ